MAANIGQPEMVGGNRCLHISQKTAFWIRFSIGLARCKMCVLFDFLPKSFKQNACITKRNCLYLWQETTIIMSTIEPHLLCVEVPLYLSEFYQNFLIEGVIPATGKSPIRQYFAFLPEKVAVSRARNKPKQNAVSHVRDSRVRAYSSSDNTIGRISVKVEENDYQKYFDGTNIDRKIAHILNLHLSFMLLGWINGYMLAKSTMRKCQRDAIRAFIDTYKMPSADVEALRIRYYRTIKRDK